MGVGTSPARRGGRRLRRRRDLDLAVANSAGQQRLAAARRRARGLHRVPDACRVTDPEAIVSGDCNRRRPARPGRQLPRAPTPAWRSSSARPRCPASSTHQPSIGVGSHAGRPRGRRLRRRRRPRPRGLRQGLGRLLSRSCATTARRFVSCGQNIPVGDKPTAIVSADFDRDGDLDLAVANDDDNNVVILRNTAGSFTLAQTLPLGGGDTSPVSLAVGDFDGDGTLDLVAAAVDNDRLHVYRNLGTSFATTPIRSTLPYVLRFVTTRRPQPRRQARPRWPSPTGSRCCRGKGALGFDPPQTVVARYNARGGGGRRLQPRRPTGRGGASNEGSDDDLGPPEHGVPAAAARGLGPAGRAAPSGSPPYLFDAAADGLRRGRQPRELRLGHREPVDRPGHGRSDGGARRAGLAAAQRRRRGLLGRERPHARQGRPLQAAVHERRAAAGPDEVLHDRAPATLQILGPNSICPSSSGTYSLDPPELRHLRLDAHADPDRRPSPTRRRCVLRNPPLAGSYQLDVAAR